MQEEWRTIKDFTDYEVSNFGEVRAATNGSGKLGEGRRKKNRKLKLLTNRKNGYLRACLKKKRIYVHKLVLEAFKPKPINMNECNHIDGNKLNNYVNNLEWSNRSLNLIHANKLGLADSAHKYKKGEKHLMSKLKERDIKRIRKLSLHGIKLKKLSEHFSISYSHIHAIIKRKYWSHI